MASRLRAALRGVSGCVLAVCVLVGCGPEQTPVEDTTGEEFLLSCNGPRHCEVELVNEPACGDEAVFVGGRYLMVCASRGMTTYFGDCRVIACQSEADCPGEAWVCGEDGLCQDPTREFVAYDVLALCLRAVPRDEVCFVDDIGMDDPRVAAALDAVSACPDLGPCEEIPEACR